MCHCRAGEVKTFIQCFYFKMACFCEFLVLSLMYSLVQFLMNLLFKVLHKRVTVRAELYVML